MPLFLPTRILRNTVQKTVTAGARWSDTLNLPKSAFPARPTAAQLERYRKRCADDLYEWQKAERPRARRDVSGKEVNNEFILHDGPPYANGAVHVGHALNKILKDTIIRWQISQGKRVHYRPGWDCHGLPIELKALQEPKRPVEQPTTLSDAPVHEEVAVSVSTMTAPAVREAARLLASEAVEQQKESFRQWGVMGEWDAPYRTMDRDFELRQLGVFREMVRKGLISRHHRPVYWSPSSRTALAEAELEYDGNHQCTAAFVKMPLISLPKILQNNKNLRPGNVYALVWTTTPWTLPANQAIAVHADMEYSVVSLDYPENHECAVDQLIIAKERVSHVITHLAEGMISKTVIETIPGSLLADGVASCLNLFLDSQSPLLAAPFVTATSGTGLVHMAPGHGMEDYQVCQQYNVGGAFAPLDDEGRFTVDAFSSNGNGALLEGLDAQSSGVEAVLQILKSPARYLPARSPIGKGSLLLASHKFTHKNPIDWRTKQPVIVRATAQWFADVSAIKERALSALDDVTFVPESGRTRLQTFVQGRSQWCISRQRAWGVPIPALYNEATGETCISDECIQHVISTIEQRGTDAWFSDPPDERAWIHPSLEEGVWTRGRDTMDVWFDSGTTWTTLDGSISDMYLEGTDQHRGWFQSSLLTAISTQDANSPSAAPFRTLVTHGFTLDAEGRKMSKSLGNVIGPDQVMDGSLLPAVKVRKQKGKPKNPSPTNERPTFDAMGPDALRLWVAGSDYTRDVNISVPVLQSVQQALQKYRVTFKFLLGVLSGCQPMDGAATLSLHEHSLTFVDKAVLHRLRLTSDAVHRAFTEYKFYKGVTEINSFVNADLSAFYFEAIKDRMYTGSVGERRSTQAVLQMLLREMMAMLGPICPHLIEEVWEYLPPALKSNAPNGAADLTRHPLRQIWKPLGRDIDADADAAQSLEYEMHVFKTVSSAVKMAQEEARNAGKLGSGLACHVEIRLDCAAYPAFAQVLNSWADRGEMADLLVVSQATVGSPEKSEDEQWGFPQPLDSPDVQGTVHVLPPKHHKCVRCWKYTAEEDEQPCPRCKSVVMEKR